MIAKITPFLAFLLCCSTLSLQATHNRGGEIEYRQIGPKELEASVITYTKVSSQPADYPICYRRHYICHGCEPKRAAYLRRQPGMVHLPARRASKCTMPGYYKPSQK